LKLIQPITTSLSVPCTSTWKHFATSLWMNTTNFIFQLLHIHNLPTLIVLIPLHSPCTPSIDFTHVFVDYVNSFYDCDNIHANCTNFYANCANKSNDCANTFVDLTNTHDRSSSNFYIPNPSLM
jgi:hypothetical protein